MELCTLSVILPVKNLAKEIGGILRLAAEQTEGLSTELIVVDMASRDKTVWESLRSIKELNIPGAVIQSGDGTVASALNTALSRASGNYVSFVFARRLFRDFLRPYCEAAQAANADIVFGTAAGEPFGKEGAPVPAPSACRPFWRTNLPLTSPPSCCGVPFLTSGASSSRNRVNTAIPRNFCFAVFAMPSVRCGAAWNSGVTRPTSCAAGRRSRQAPPRSNAWRPCFASRNMWNPVCRTTSGSALSCGKGGFPRQ